VTIHLNGSYPGSDAPVLASGISILQKEVYLRHRGWKSSHGCYDITSEGTMGISQNKSGKPVFIHFIFPVKV